MENIKLGERVTIEGPVKTPFRPERVFISAARTTGGAADWIVNDVRIDGKTQFLNEGSLPGDMFESRAIDGFVRFQVATKMVEIDVTYCGLNSDGASFYSSIIGTTDLDANKTASGIHA